MLPLDLDRLTVPQLRAVSRDPLRRPELREAARRVMLRRLEEADPQALSPLETMFRFMGHKRLRADIEHLRATSRPAGFWGWLFARRPPGPRLPRRRARFGAEPFDPKVLVVKTIQKTKAGTLPPPSTWTQGLSGTALTLGEGVRSWVVDHVVEPVLDGTWDAVVLAGAATHKAEVEGLLAKATDADRATVSAAISKVLR